MSNENSVKGLWAVVKTQNGKHCIPVKIESNKLDKVTFYGWAFGERLHEYARSAIMITCETEEAANNYIKSICDENGVIIKEANENGAEDYSASSLESLNDYASGLGDACKDLKPGDGIIVKGYYVERSDDGQTYYVWVDLDESINEDAEPRKRVSYRGYIIRPRKSDDGELYYDIIKPKWSTTEPIWDWCDSVEEAKQWIDSDKDEPFEESKSVNESKVVPALDNGYHHRWEISDTIVVHDDGGVYHVVQKDGWKNTYIFNSADINEVNEFLMKNFDATIAEAPDDKSINNDDLSEPKLNEDEKDDILFTVAMGFETGHHACEDFDEFESEFSGISNAKAGWEYYCELVNLGPAGFYAEHKDDYIFDDMFIAEYGDGDLEESKSINESLASRLVDFYKDYDFYDYMDVLEVDETDEDAVKQMNSMLGNNKYTNDLLDKLNDISKEELDDEQKEIVNSLIVDVKKLLNKNESKSIKEDIARDFTLNKTNYSDAEHYWGYIIARRVDNEHKCDIFQIVNGKPELKCGDGVPDAVCRMLIDGWNKEFFDSEAMDRLFPIESKSIEEKYTDASDVIGWTQNSPDEKFSSIGEYKGYTYGKLVSPKDVSGWYLIDGPNNIVIGNLSDNTYGSKQELISALRTEIHRLNLDESKSIKESDGDNLDNIQIVDKACKAANIEYDDIIDDPSRGLVVLYREDKSFDETELKSIRDNIVKLSSKLTGCSFYEDTRKIEFVFDINKINESEGRKAIRTSTVYLVDYEDGMSLPFDDRDTAIDYAIDSDAKQVVKATMYHFSDDESDTDIDGDNSEVIWTAYPNPTTENLKESLSDDDYLHCQACITDDVRDYLTDDELAEISDYIGSDGTIINCESGRCDIRFSDEFVVHQIPIEYLEIELNESKSVKEDLSDCDEDTSMLEKMTNEGYDPLAVYSTYEIKNADTDEVIRKIHTTSIDPDDSSTWFDDDDIINQYAGDGIIITRYDYDQGMLDKSEVIYPEESEEIDESIIIETESNDFDSELNDCDEFKFGVNENFELRQSNGIIG